MSGPRFKSKEEELLYRVFLEIQQGHFTDFKMIPAYCEEIRFSRSLGEAVGGYIQGKQPKQYHKNRRYFERRSLQEPEA